MIDVVLGTRPEIIKFSPVIDELEKAREEYRIVHTNQHYSYELDRIFFEELNLRPADYNINAGSGTHGHQTASIIEGVEQVLSREKPSTVLVQGDTNTVLGAALASVKMRIPVGHVEAGLRSYDRTMPEETNRIIADHISTYLFAPTELSRKNLEKEGITDGVHVVGNTIVEATHRNAAIAEKKSKALKQFNLKQNGYAVMTAHRQENVDDAERLSNIITCIGRIASETGLQVLFPVHPRTSKMLAEFGYEKRFNSTRGLVAVKPTGYLDFLMLEKNAALAVTDSGGVQEEACILGVPCVTIRENTERPETVEVGANIIAGTKPDAVMKAVQKSLDSNRKWENPLGDGTASRQILEILGK